MNQKRITPDRAHGSSHAREIINKKHEISKAFNGGHTTEISDIGVD